MPGETTVTESSARPLPLSRRAHEFVAHELLVLILSGGFEPGDRLPAERALAADFGVSRPTVRQAVSTLAARGLVEARVGSGTFVVGPPAGVAAPAADAAATLAEVMEARLVFEVGGVRLAARRRAQRNREDTGLLGAVVDALERVDERGLFPVEIDIAFHRSSFGSPGTPGWRRSWHRAGRRSRRSSRPQPAARGRREDTGRMAAQHRAVFEALRLGDAELAGFEMERHLRAELARLAGGEDPDGPPSRFFA